PNTKRYVPPVRASTSQEMNDIPNDFGVHQRMISSGLVQASNTMCAGALKIRVMTSSRSDFRSIVVGLFMGLDSLSLVRWVDAFRLFELLNDPVQLVEACVPELALTLDPRSLLLQPAWTELAGPQAAGLRRGGAPRLRQNADVLLQAGAGPPERSGKFCR